MCKSSEVRDLTTSSRTCQMLGLTGRKGKVVRSAMGWRGEGLRSEGRRVKGSFWLPCAHRSDEMRLEARRPEGRPGAACGEVED